jgi:hypothetical protein
MRMPPLPPSRPDAYASSPSLSLLQRDRSREEAAVGKILKHKVVPRAPVSAVCAVCWLCVGRL